MPTYAYTGSVQTFTVTNTGTYDVTAFGGGGGGSQVPMSGTPVPGGLGTSISGDFYLKAGATLTIIVGGEGGNSTNYGGGGGGGGTFVIENYNSVRTVLEIAGGGGGAYQGSGGGGGQTGPYGGHGGGGMGGAGGAHGSGGTAGGISGAGSGAGGGFTGGSVVSGVAGSGGGYGTGYAGGSGYAGASGGFGGGGGGGMGGGGGGGGYSGGGGGGVDEGGDGGVGGGGGSYFGTGSSESLGTNAGNGSVSLNFVCYLRGTHILTPSGEALVEDLAIGDPVVTRFAGIQKIKWIGHQHVAARSGKDDRRHVPVHIRPDALGDRQPARDLFISPGHSMLMDGLLLLGRALVNGVTITQDWCPDAIHYIHLELDRHDCVLAEGAWSETFADAPHLRGIFHNAADFAARYPDQPPCPDLYLCAPRPDGGDLVDLALRPVVLRAGAALTPGPLRGFIDHIGAPWTIEGWAQDTDHPELPVLLEALLEDRVIGTALACNDRPDLRQAGIGHGRHGFRLTSIVDLRPGSLNTLRIRRAADQVDIPQTANCMTRFTADWFAAAVSRLQRAA